MITINHTNRGKGCLSSRGFSLIELLVVVAILGALAATVSVYINTADAKLKSYAFNLGSKFKLAKFEAVKRGRDVYIDFDMNGNLDPSDDNGYTIWVNNDQDDPVIYDEWVLADDDANGNEVCDEEEGDCVIGDPVEFSPAGSAPGPVLYDDDGTPSGGPAVGPGGNVIGDGVAAGGERFGFRPTGDSTNGTLYIYYPSGAVGAEVVAAGPWAIIVNQAGRIRLDQWLPAEGRWKVNL